MVISTPDRYIHYVSRCWVGKSHDYRMLKHEFPAELGWFKKHAVQLDLGYQGFEKDYECQKVMIPKKKSAKHPLSEAEKQQNRGKIVGKDHRRTCHWRHEALPNFVRPTTNPQLQNVQ